MNAAQLTTLTLEAFSLLLLLLFLSFFIREKFKGIEKRNLYTVSSIDAGVLHRSFLGDVSNRKAQELSMAVLIALLLGAVFGITFLDVIRTNTITSFFPILIASVFVYYTGIFMIISMMYRVRESRIMLYKFTYRYKNASGKTITTNLLRQSLYFMDKKKFKRKKRTDFSMRPDVSTLFIVISLTSMEVFNIVYFIDLLAPL